ncbi:MAG: DUF6816 family protein [Mastigocoleus sp.]
MRKIWLILILCFICCFSKEAIAGELAQRLSEFPQWERIKSVQNPQGDLVYPQWMEGEWEVKSTLVDLVAPLAPDIVTPGFGGNRQYLNQPISFRVKFLSEKKLNSDTIASKTVNSKAVNSKSENYFTFPHISKIFSQDRKSSIVADRAFNGLNLARAYLGDKAVINVKVDPDSPNRQITLLRGKCDFDTVCDRQLISLVKGRATERDGEDIFTSCEVFQQFFKGDSRPYFNSVESTTEYHRLSNSELVNLKLSDSKLSDSELVNNKLSDAPLSNSELVNPKLSNPNLSTTEPEIEANQVTAVYLSPQDPNYFKATSHPVALYRYRLEFKRADN